jgi:hypothetical protein
MKRFVFLMALVVAFGAVAGAANVCGSNPAQNVLAGNYSCSLGGLTFDNFSAVPNWTPPPSLVINIMGTSNFTNGVVYLNFNPNLWVDVGNPPLDVYFQFRVTGSVNQVDLRVLGTGAFISEYVCDDQGLDPNGGCWGDQLANLGNSSGNPRVWAYFYQNQSYEEGPIWVWKDINVHSTPGNPGMPGELSQFSQSFHVPEPLTLTLIGSGLLGFGLLRRRLKK